MKRTIEVELRYKISDKQTIPLQFGNGKRIIDIYYDTKFGEYFKRGIFIRNRNGKQLDFKFNKEEIEGKSEKNDHTHCDDSSIRIPFGDKANERLESLAALLGFNIPRKNDFKSFVKENSLEVLAEIDKIRKKSSKNGFEICLDEVKSIGSFLEIEKVIEVENIFDGNFDKVKADIRNFVSDLGICVEQSPIGYCELALRKSNFGLYVQGRYVLDEDKI